jgi:predicted nucleic acid-binding protein
VKQNATLDSSFWIHAVAGGVVAHLLDDFELHVAPEVSLELTEAYPSGAHLQQVIRDGRIRVSTPKSLRFDRFGPGERAAISLALENPEWTLLIDDLRPFRAAEELDLAPVSSPVYATSLFERGVLDLRAILDALARLSARSTVSPQLIDLALTQVATIDEKRRN